MVDDLASPRARRAERHRVDSAGEGIEIVNPSRDFGVGSPMVFGKAYPGVEYRQRPSVYAILDRGDGRIAIMRVDDRAYLPGGGAEVGESWEETVRREVVEEMGWTLRDVERLVETVEFLQPSSPRSGTRVEATFVRAVMDERIADPIELDHHLDWLDPRDAAEVLTHRSHAWVAGEFWRRRSGH